MFRKLFFPIFLLLSAPFAAAEVRVVASITPLQLIAAEVLDGIAKPEVLIPPGASPHAYSLRPSDTRKIHDADLVVWVGPELEQFLTKPISQSNATKLMLLDDQARLHAQEHAGEDGHEGHDHGGVDPHIWLDPFNALAAAEKLRDQVIAIKPEYTAQLNSNYDDFAARLIAVDRQLQRQLNPLSGQGFITFHDAYQHFIGHYNLKQIDNFTVNPSRKPGAKHLAQLRDKIAASEAVCIFSEPQFSDALVRSIIGGNPIKTAELDPLGQDVSAEKGAYITFLTQFSQQFVDCLGQ